MDRHARILEEAIFAFQDERVVKLIAGIIDKDDLQPDVDLYAGGISAMGQTHFLNPHVDNSHDKERARWRVLNLLYYVSEDWSAANGGSLGLWPKGISGPAVELPSLFNRLVVMATHQQSWHSVSPVRSAGIRKCVSNYYFSPTPIRETDAFHVTSFRGRPEQKIVDPILRADAAARSRVRKIKPGGIRKTDHFYKR